MGHSIGRHVRHNTVAYLALFVALGGTSLAAKPLLTGADVQDESLTGADVRSLTAADIDVTTLTTVDADKLDGLNSTAFLGVGAKAADADKLDNLDSSAFLGANATAADADKLDNLDSSAFLGANAKAADADTVDNLDSTAFARSTSEAWHELGHPGEIDFESFGGPPLWQSYGGTASTVAFYKDAVGVVHLKGVARWISTTSSFRSCGPGQGLMFTLPAGYAPAQHEAHLALRGTGNPVGFGSTVRPFRVIIGTDGGVYPCITNFTTFPNDPEAGLAPGDDQWVGLDGISWRAG